MGDQPRCERPVAPCWQGRGDSNPEPPVLETGALAVRATPLRPLILRWSRPPRNTPPPEGRGRVAAPASAEVNGKLGMGQTMAPGRVTS